MAHHRDEIGLQLAGGFGLFLGADEFAAALAVDEDPGGADQEHGDDRRDRQEHRLIVDQGIGPRGTGNLPTAVGKRDFDNAGGVLEHGAFTADHAAIGPQPVDASNGDFGPGIDTVEARTFEERLDIDQDRREAPEIRELGLPAVAVYEDRQPGDDCLPPLDQIEWPGDDELSLFDRAYDRGPPRFVRQQVMAERSAVLLDIGEESHHRVGC